MENIREVFTGDSKGSFSWHWLFPIDISKELLIENEFK